MKPWETLMVKAALVLLILAGLGPFVARFTLAQTLLLSLVVAGWLHLVDLFFLPRLRPFLDNRAFSAAEALAAALLLLLFAAPLAAGFNLTDALILGAALGLLEYAWHSWHFPRENVV